MRLQKIKTKIFSIFVAIATALALVPAGAINVYAADDSGTGLDEPEVAKTLEDNGDGTYTISLSVKGQKKTDSERKGANVVVVLDTSSSMDSNRMATAKSAVNSLAEQLLGKNGDDGDLVEMAFITFSGDVKINNAPTTSLSTFQGWVNSVTTSRGTNWEAALKAANEVSFKDNDPIYIVFVSDGNPTESISSGRDHFGHAKVYADAIIEAGKKLYAIGVFGNVSNMQGLGGTYYSATDEDALNTAFSQIVSQITNNLSLTNIVFTDGITGETTAEINGVAGGFVYRKGTLADGADVSSLPVWEDAPEASFSNNVVTWDLGETTIENGVTAAVSFVVYPSQEVLDLVADLNNGVTEWKDEYATDIVKNGDSYSLKTNTAGTKMSYKTVNQKTENGQTTTEYSEVKTAEIENPEAVALYSEKLDVKKIWEDSLDGGSERGEVEDVVLDLYRDGELYIPGITLNSENTDSDGNWTLADKLSIAPGIMVSEEHAAYENVNTKITEMDENGQSGKTYAILDFGHDYKFKEANPDKHFELNNNTFHPMLVDNELKNVHFQHAKDADVSESDYLMILGEITDFVSATNTLKGGINIEKKVLDNDGNEITPAEGTKFTISAELVDWNNEAYACEYKVYDTEGNASEKKYCDQGGKLSEEIEVGELIRVVNVDSGVHYKVSEDEDDLELGYSLKEIKYEISKGSADNYETAEDGFTDREGNEWHTVLGNSASRATVVNEYLTGSLVVGKEVSVLSGNVAKAKAKNFEFTLTVTGKDGEILQTEDFSLTDGKTRKFENIPAGAKYSVTEKELAGFTTRVSGNTGEIEAREELEAKFTNIYSVAPVSADLTATKMFGMFDEWWRGDEFTFALLDAQKTELERKKVNQVSKTASFSVDFADEDQRTYYITELTDDFRGGVFRSEDDLDVKYEVSAVDDGEGNLIVTTKVSDEKDYIQNDYAMEAVTFGEDGSETEDYLTVYKELVSESEEESTEEFEFTFELEYSSDEEFAENFEMQTATIVGNGSAKFDALTFEKPGVYVFRVTETNKGTEFYSYDPSIYYLYLEVWDDNEGHLYVEIAEIWREIGEEWLDADEIVFTNFYNPESEGEVVEPAVVTPQTGVYGSGSADGEADGTVSVSYMSYVLGFAAMFMLAGIGFGIKTYTRREK